MPSTKPAPSPHIARVCPSYRILALYRQVSPDVFSQWWYPRGAVILGYADMCVLAVWTCTLHVTSKDFVRNTLDIRLLRTELYEIINVMPTARTFMIKYGKALPKWRTATSTTRIVFMPEVPSINNNLRHPILFLELNTTVIGSKLAHNFTAICRNSRRLLIPVSTCQ